MPEPLNVLFQLSLTEQEQARFGRKTPNLRAFIGHVGAELGLSESHCPSAIQLSFVMSDLFTDEVFRPLNETTLESYAATPELLLERIQVTSTPERCERIRLVLQANSDPLRRAVQARWPGTTVEDLLDRIELASPPLAQMFYHLWIWCLLASNSPLFNKWVLNQVSQPGDRPSKPHTAP